MNDYSAEIALWNQGKRLREIAAELGLNANTVAAHIRSARKQLGEKAVPHRSVGRKVGSVERSPLDRLQKTGDEMRARKTRLGTRQNVHQLAAARGWQISLHDAGKTWVITALRKTEDIETQESKRSAHELALT